MTSKTFPTLYGKNKNGVWKVWKIRVNKPQDKDDGGVVIETQHGQWNGKMITDTLTISEKKRGYDTLYEQAVFIAQSKWNHKHNRENYQTTMEEHDDNVVVSGNHKKKSTNSTIISPMLAKTYENGKHLHFPVYAQPKIDGLRCMAHQNGLFSRTGCLFYGLDPIKNDLKKYFEKNGTCVLDGELYTDEMPFEELSGYCRRQKEIPSVKKVMFHVFDVIDASHPEAGFKDRMKLFPEETGYVKIVPATEITKKDEVEKNLKNFIRDGYEGIILRNKNGVYRSGHRSWDLQKYKLFQEEEFVIVGFTEGKGREKEMVIWECQTKEGQRFHVRPEGDHSMRREMYKNAEKQIGKKLTVVFQEYTKDRIPRFPVAKAIREKY